MKYIVEEKLVSFKTFEQKVFDHVCELGREMTRIILGLEKIPKPDDTADALAMAICHGHCSGSLMGRLNVSK